jgi:hypothetical protein
MIGDLDAVRLIYLQRLHEALEVAAKALKDLKDAETSSPVGRPEAWAYPEFLLTVATTEVLTVLDSLGISGEPKGSKGPSRPKASA